MDIRTLVRDAHQNALFKGFWDDYQGMVKHGYQSQAIDTRLMLIVGELSEAEDALRKGDYAHIAEELADVVIRTADLAGGLGFDLEKAIEEKMERNKHRPRLHGKKF